MRTGGYNVPPDGPAGAFQGTGIRNRASPTPILNPITTLYAQVIPDFYLVGLLTAAATLLGGCVVLPTMARNTLRGMVSRVLTVRTTLRGMKPWQCERAAAQLLVRRLHLMCTVCPGSAMAAHGRGAELWAQW